MTGGGGIIYGLTILFIYLFIYFLWTDKHKCGVEWVHRAKLLAGRAGNLHQLWIFSPFTSRWRAPACQVIDQAGFAFMINERPPKLSHPCQTRMGLVHYSQFILFYIDVFPHHFAK